jgi:hypothetical protein
MCDDVSHRSTLVGIQICRAPMAIAVSTATLLIPPTARFRASPPNTGKPVCFAAMAARSAVSVWWLLSITAPIPAAAAH